MTASTDRFVDIAKRPSDAMMDSFRTWTETVQGLAGQFTGGGRPQLPDTTVAVDRVFDFAEQVSHSAGTASQATKDAAEKAAGAARSTRASSK